MQAIDNSCDHPDSICQPFIEPLVMPAGACTDDNQCMSGLYCIGDTGDADGSCGERLALGMPCEGDRDCQSGSCSTVCDAKAALGEACYADSACASAYCDYATQSCAQAPYSDACEL